MAKTPGSKIKKPKSNLAIASAGLPTQDKNEINALNRDISRDWEIAQRSNKTGLTTAINDRKLNVSRSLLNRQQNNVLGASRAADSSLGASPAVYGALLNAGAQRQAAEAAQAVQEEANAKAALESMLQQAKMDRKYQLAELTREAARRQNAAQQIRRYGA